MVEVREREGEREKHPNRSWKALRGEKTESASTTARAAV